MANRRSNKPYVVTINNDGETVYIDYPTYRDLVKDLKRTLNMFLDNRYKSFDSISRRNYVGVYRSRRGEWGEWFEHWELKDLKIHKINEGWM